MKKLYTLLCAVLIGIGANAQYNVTFSVDMSDVADVSDDGVHVAGSFQDWSPAGTPLTDQGDGTWSVTVSLEAGEYEFKFLNGNDWPFEEVVPDACRADLSGNTNRKVVVEDTDVTYAVCYSSCAACGDYAVLFRVDMSLEEEVAPQGVHVAGDFQGWNASANPLNDNGDGTWSALYTFNPSILDNGVLVFKYINGDDWIFPNENITGDCGSNSNRNLELTTANTVTPSYCFNLCGTCVAPIPVTFKVDMSNEDVSDLGVHIAGQFQGWAAGDSEMSDLDGDGIYEITFDLQPGIYPYKFINGNNWGMDESVPSGCATDNNRTVEVVEGDPIEVQSCFGQCAEFCTANPDPAEITFYVNTSEIEVSASGIWLMGNFTTPVWQPGAIEMTDGGDGIYSATVLVSGAAEFQYKFTNGDPYPDGSVDATVEETYDFALGLCGAPNGIGGFNRIHIRSGAPEVLDMVCYNSCVECGANVGEMKNPFGINLYPNPTNEVLNLVASNLDGMTEVTIYDISGRVISSTSMNLTSGSIQVLDVSSLTTGMYFVQLLANGKRSTHSFSKN